MEIYKIKRNGCEVNVIFTGKQYIFHNSYFGILLWQQEKVIRMKKCAPLFLSTETKTR